MRVLHVMNELGSGGAEKLVTDLCLHMPNDVKTAVYVFSDRNMRYEKPLLDAGIPVHVARDYRLKDPRHILALLKFLKQRRFDVVHVHLFPSLYFGALTKRLRKRRRPVFVYTEHSTNNRRRDRRWMRPLERFMYRSYDRVTAVSDQALQALLDWVGADTLAGKTRVIENGVDTAVYRDASGDSLRDELALPEGSRLFTMISRFSAMKDHATVVDALELLPSDVHIAFAGEGPEMETVRKQVQKAGLTERVHFLGYRSDIPAIIAASDGIIQSSVWEGFGLTAVEAMAAGKPVFASDVPGMREIVDGAGFLFPQGDANRLASLLRDFSAADWDNDRARRAMERANRYDLQHTVQSYLKLYTER